MVDNQLGVGIAWGIGAFTFSATGSIVESFDLSEMAEKNIFRNTTGSTIGIRYWDKHEEINVNCWITGSAGISNATANKPVLGTLITITATETPDAVGTTWIVEESNIARVNTDVAKLKVKCVKYPLITS